MLRGNECRAVGKDGKTSGLKGEPEVGRVDYRFGKGDVAALPLHKEVEKGYGFESRGKLKKNTVFVCNTLRRKRREERPI